MKVRSVKEHAQSYRPKDHGPSSAPAMSASFAGIGPGRELRSVSLSFNMDSQTDKGRRVTLTLEPGEARELREALGRVVTG